MTKREPLWFLGQHEADKQGNRVYNRNMPEFKPYAMDQRQLLPPHMKIPYLRNTWRSCQFSHRQSGSEQAVQQASRNRLSGAPPAYDAESPALCPVLKRPIRLGRLPQIFAGTSLSWGLAEARKPGFRKVNHFRAEMKESVEEVFYAWSAASPRVAVTNGKTALPRWRKD